ncbi:MAG: hypothetical protein M3P22_02380 [bacterium]|nr:hypothetical protein [bacterium]
MENNTKKEELQKEKNLLIEEMNDMGVRDPQTGRWQAVPFAQDIGEADPNDVADRNEDFESRSSILAVLQDRLDAIEQKLAE